MKEFIIKERTSSFKMILPTSLKEITEEYLLGVTNHIVVAPYHVICAVVYRAKLPEIISSAKKSRALATAIVPLFVRATTGDAMESKTSVMFNDIKCGDRLIIAGTSIEMGYQLSCPKNFITIENLIGVYNKDMDFAKGVMIDQNYYYFLDFKLIPMTEIKGFYKTSINEGFVNPFIYPLTENKELN